MEKVNSVNISKIEFLNRAEVLHSSDSINAIVEFVKILASAENDTTGVTYKSFDFVKFYAGNGQEYRIAIKDNRFIAGGKKYIANFNIKEQYMVIFKIHLE